MLQETTNAAAATGGNAATALTQMGVDHLLAEMLGDRLKISVEHANPLARLNIRDGALESLTTDEVAPLLMLPIGLALRQ